MKIGFIGAGTMATTKTLVIDLINTTGLVALDLGSLAQGGAMQQIGAPLSGVELHFVRRVAR